MLAITLSGHFWLPKHLEISFCLGPIDMIRYANGTNVGQTVHEKAGIVLLTQPIKS